MLRRREVWIFKPCNASCGRGIRLLTKESKIPKRSGVVQRSPRPCKKKSDDSMLAVALCSRRSSRKAAARSF